MNAQLENAPTITRARPNWAVVSAQTDRIIALEAELADLESRANEGWDRYRSEKLTADRMLDYATRQLKERLLSDEEVARLTERERISKLWFRWFWAPSLLLLGALIDAAVRAGGG